MKLKHKPAYMTSFFMFVEFTGWAREHQNSPDVRKIESAWFGYYNWRVAGVEFIHE